MSPVPQRIALVAVAAAALAAAGCGGTNLDPSKLEAQSKENLQNTLPQRLAQGKPGEELQKQLGVTPDVKVKAVECPSGVALEVGRTFDCTVVFVGGQTTTETFRIENEDGDVTQVSLGPHEIDRSQRSQSSK